MTPNGKSADKYKCGCCDTISIVGDILKAPSPFNTQDELWGCSHCFAAEDFNRVCDTDDCISISVVGMPIGDEYKFLCREHAQYALARTLARTLASDE